MKAFCNYFSYISIVIIIVTAALVKRISEIFNYFFFPHKKVSLITGLTDIM